MEVRSYPHIYYITAGMGRTEGFLRECEGCGLVLDASAAEVAASIRDRHANLDELAEKTAPNFDRVWADRLQFERQVATGTTSPEVRAGAILEPFLLLNPALEGRNSSTHFDTVSGVVILISLGAVIAFLFLVAPHPGTLFGYDRTVVGLLAVALTGLIASGLAMLNDLGRYARKCVLPSLARSLKPLDPSGVELAQCLRTCRDRDLLIAKVFRAADVTDAVAVARLHN